MRRKSLNKKGVFLPRQADRKILAFAGAGDALVPPAGGAGVQKQRKRESGPDIRDGLFHQFVGIDSQGGRQLVDSVEESIAPTAFNRRNGRAMEIGKGGERGLGIFPFFPKKPDPLAK